MYRYMPPRVTLYIKKQNVPGMVNTCVLECWGKGQGWCCPYRPMGEQFSNAPTEGDSYLQCVHDFLIQNPHSSLILVCLQFLGLCFNLVGSVFSDSFIPLILLPLI